MSEDFYDLPKHSTIRNYIIPGLTSHLIGDWSDPTKERLRMFEMEIPQLTMIVPHSHRYDFHCRVVAGIVTNILWKEVTDPKSDGIDMALSHLTYGGIPGQYEKRSIGLTRYTVVSSTYPAGATYCMKSDEIHSIVFCEGAKVLFWEGPQISNTTSILEPYVPEYGAVPLFKTEPWMFVHPNQHTLGELE